MDGHDEPLLRTGKPDRGPAARAPAARDRVRSLLGGQPFAVLCTQGEGQPYGSLVAFAASEDLGSVAFATSRATRKYHLLCESPSVSLVIDSRPSYPDDMIKVEAVTATGRATELEAGPEYDRWTALLSHRHPQIASFVCAPSTALFRIDIARYLHVSRFQEVRQWIPQPAG